MGEVIKLETVNALVKVIKACIGRADLAMADTDHWRHKAGVKLIALKKRCAHGEWMPYLKTIGITQQRASELMDAGRDETAPAKERQRNKLKERLRRARKRKSPARAGDKDEADDGDQTPEERWQNSLANLAGDIIAIQAYWAKEFGSWHDFDIPSHIQKLVREAATEFASLAAELVARRQKGRSYGT